MRGFINFVREQGVVGFAVGFMLGGAISKVVAAFVNDIVNPLIGAAFGNVRELKDAAFTIGSSKILWGDFVSVTVDFIVIALVVYFGVKILKLDRIDRKKE